MVPQRNMVQASLVPSKETPETVEGAEGERGIGKREMGSEGTGRRRALSSLVLHPLSSRYPFSIFSMS